MSILTSVGESLRLNSVAETSEAARAARAMAAGSASFIAFRTIVIGSKDL